MSMMKWPMKKSTVMVWGLQVLSALFFMAHQDVMIQYLPIVGWSVLPIALYFAWQQRAEVWQGLRDQRLSPWRYATVLLFMFSFFALLLWQVAALSLTLIYPYLNFVNDQPVAMTVAPKQLLVWCLQGAFSLWLLIGCMALGINVVKHRSQTSILAPRFHKLRMISRYAEHLLLISSLAALYVLSMLLILQIAKSATVLAGYDQVNVPYLGMGVFFLVMYLFNAFYQFSKRHRKQGTRASTGLAYVLLRQMGFYVLVWTLSIIVTLCLPEGILSTLSTPMGAAVLSPDLYAAYWQMTILVWGLCAVPMLSLLLARYSSGLPILQSTALIFLLPLGLVVSMNGMLLHSGSFIDLFNTGLHYQWTPITESILIFSPSFLSITAGLSVLALLCVFKYCAELSQAWVGIMPTHVGRRIVRLKKHMARLFGFSMTLYMIYMMMGAIALSMIFASYLLALLLYMILHLGQGLFMGLTVPTLPFTWKRGVDHGYL